MMRRAFLLSLVCLSALGGACNNFSIYDLFTEDLEILPNVAAVQTDGSIKFSAEGGRPPYSFQFMEYGGGQIDSTGRYIAASSECEELIQLTDSRGVAATAYVSVVAPLPLLLSPASATIAASSDFPFTVEGGTRPYTFSLGGEGVGNFEAAADSATYYAPNQVTENKQDSLIVTDAKGRTSTAAITVVPTTVIQLQGPTEVVEAASVTFLATNASGGYSFSLSKADSGGIIDGASGLYTAGTTLGAGLDVVMVTDAKSSASLSVNVIPKAPSGLFAADGSAGKSIGVKLSWNLNSASACNVSVERRIGSDDFVIVKNLSPGAATYVDKGLSVGTTYSYRVRAYLNGVYSEYSQVVSYTP